METTPRLALPLLAAGQSLKEVFHNEALYRIDACIAACVAGPPTATPPVSPSVGDCFLVGAGASGAWSDRDDSLALFSDGGWRFILPGEGMRVWALSANCEAVYLGGAWDLGTLRGASLAIDGTQVIGPQESAIVTPAGGTVVDSEARTAIAQMLSALRAHGLIAT